MRCWLCRQGVHMDLGSLHAVQGFAKGTCGTCWTYLSVWPRDLPMIYVT